jgi:hypothetical protein
MWSVSLAKALAWPLVTLVMAALFRSEMKGIVTLLLSKLLTTSELELLGFKAKFAAQEQPVSNEPDVKLDGSAPSEQVVVSPGPLGQAIDILRLSLQAEIEKWPPEERVGVALKALAEARFENQCLQVYGLIFGSQLEGLRQLEARRRITTAAAFEFFQSVARTLPGAYGDSDFAQWLEFMVRTNLVQRDKDDIVIAPFGLLFMAWVRARNIPMNKPL